MCKYSEHCDNYDFNTCVYLDHKSPPQCLKSNGEEHQTEQAEASSLNAMLKAKEHLERENAALTNLLENICNDLMDVDDAGRFTNSFYADTVNKMLGL